MKRWLEVSLHVPGAGAEAISNFLIEEGAVGIEEVDEESGWQRIRGYFAEVGRSKKVLRDLGRYLESLRKIRPELAHYRMETSSVTEQDWGENWKKFFKPVQAGSRFLVKPPWSKVRSTKGRIPIDITPGMAFGTGTHASTRLCIEALEKRLKRKGLSVLDLGTGSGILSIAAAKLGAGEVRGLDTDGVAVGVAQDNISKNSVSGVVKIRKGSIGDLREKFDVIVANIDFKGLKKLRYPLLRHLKGKGFLILSGVLAEEKEKIRQHYLETRLLRWVKTVAEEEWVCLTFKKE
jgi:ribosomal protein L11 methyltransferase